MTVVKNGRNNCKIYDIEQDRIKYVDTTFFRVKLKLWHN